MLNAFKTDQSFAVLCYDGLDCLRANQLFNAAFHIEMRVALETGGRLVLAARHVSDFGDPQMTDPLDENYVYVESRRSGLEWTLGLANDWRRHPWNRGIDLTLTTGRVEPGDTLTVFLGDPDRHGPGYRCQSFVESACRFRLGLDPCGDDQWIVLPVDACPAFCIEGNMMVGISTTVVRMTAGRGKGVANIKAEDAFGNPAGIVAGEISLLLDGTRTVGRAPLARNAACAVGFDYPRDGRWHTLIAATDDGAFSVRSNPFGPSPVKGYQLFWGEIHAQSGLCDGTNSPTELYAYARDAAGLDFASVTSHDFELTRRDWDEILDATKMAHRPGEFVTFPGVEWSGKSDMGGDNNIYFLDDNAPQVYSAPYGGYSAWDAAEGSVTGSRDLNEVIRQLEAESCRFMIVPHCGGRCCNFDFYNPRVMPLFEIHSCHRTFEHMAYEAIRRGLPFGFIGGSDDHRCALGDSHPAARERYFSSHNGLVAVYARDLTRACLWEAFFARRVYATDGPRIVLDVCIDDTLMGGVCPLQPGREPLMTLRVRLDGFLDKIDIIQDTHIVRTVGNRCNQVEEFESEVVLPPVEKKTAFFVRVTQAGGGRAWSSPIWVEPRA